MAFSMGFSKTAAAKTKYSMRALDQLDPHNEDEAWTAKIDGAYSIVRMEKGKLPRVFSHRISKRTGKQIEYTDKLLHLKKTSPVTGEFIAETYATDRSGKAVEPEMVTALLTRTVERSHELQKEKGLKTHTALIDAVSSDGKFVRKLPFGAKRKLLEEVSKENPDFSLPDIAYSAKDKSKLKKAIIEQKHLQTEEGLIVHDLHGEDAPFAKAKLYQEHDVYVREIFPEESPTGRQPMAGGFRYSWTPQGEIKGHVGTGFDHALKKDMLKNPMNYFGRIARVHATKVSKNRALLKPSFKHWHVEKNITDQNEPHAKQTVIIDKSIAKDRSAAEAAARPFADRMYTSRETGQSFRFRQIPPSKFITGTYRTFQPKPGVSIVYGQLKKKPS